MSYVVTGYLVKAGDKYISTGACSDVWTDKQRDAMRFIRWERAFDCAEAWRLGPGAVDARVVKLVKR